MALVFDSTTLIYFAKLKIIDKLAKLKEALIIPESVYAEVVIEGKRKEKEDAFLIEKLVHDGVFNVNKSENKKLINHLLRIPSIDYADAETLVVAKELGETAILDETPSRTVAEMENIKFHGSIFLLFLLYRKKLISKKEIKIYVDRMIGLGWRCSTELYAAILDEIEKL